MSTETCVFYTTLSCYRPELLQRLPDAERQRAKARTSAVRQQLFVLGRVLLADSLRSVGGIDQDSDYELCYSPHGKPLLCVPDDWQFNLTHSGEHLFLALRRHHAIGIDSEILRPRRYQRLAEKLFSPQAQHAIATATEPMPIFYRLWTRYEAQVKYLGLSVFSDLPKEPKRYLRSYHYQSLIFSLCSHVTLEEVCFYRQTESDNEKFLPIVPTLL